MKALKVLIVDDHPMICDGYKLFLQNWSKEKKESKIQFYTAHDCCEGLNAILKHSSSLDLCILDIRIPMSKADNLFSGEDLGIRIRNICPNIKVIVVTGILENYRLYNIFKNLNPEGLLIKNDLDNKVFIGAVELVLQGKPCYSPTFSSLLRNQFTKNYTLDSKDRKLLYLLSKGMKLKDLPDELNLSLSAIEKRKRMLSEYFRAEGQGTFELINAATRRGFL